MSARRALSRLCFAFGTLLLGGALASFLAAYALPAEGLQDLGRVAGGLLLAALAGVPFALSLLLGGRGVPRWRLAVAGLGCLAAAVPAASFLATGVVGLAVVGGLSLLVALAGLLAAGRLWRAPGTA